MAEHSGSFRSDKLEAYILFGRDTNGRIEYLRPIIDYCNRMSIPTISVSWEEFNWQDARY